MKLQNYLVLHQHFLDLDFTTVKLPGCGVSRNEHQREYEFRNDLTGTDQRGRLSLQLTSDTGPC